MGKKDRARALTRNEKEAMVAYDLPWKDYLFLENISESYFVAVHKDTGRRKVIDRYARPKRKRYNR